MFYSITDNKGQYLSAAVVRTRLLAAMRKLDVHPYLATTSLRIMLADRIMSDHQWMRSKAHQVVASVCNDALSEIITYGRWVPE